MGKGAKAWDTVRSRLIEEGCDAKIFQKTPKELAKLFQSQRRKLISMLAVDPGEAEPNLNEVSFRVKIQD